MISIPNSQGVLLSSPQKMSYQSVIDSIHDNWKRQLVVFRHEKRVTMSENLNYINQYGPNQLNNYSEPIINSGIVWARIWHMNGLSANKMLNTSTDGDHEFTARGEPQLRFVNNKDYIRLKLDITGYNLLNGAKSAAIDNYNYNVLSAYRAGGLFLPEYYTVWLEQNQ